MSRRALDAEALHAPRRDEEIDDAEEGGAGAEQSDGARGARLDGVQSATVMAWRRRVVWIFVVEGVACHDTRDIDEADRVRVSFDEAL